MQNQFFYTRKDQESGKEFRDSLNPDKIIRSVTQDDGTLLVLLDDIHERSHDVPDIDLRTNKMKGMKRQKSVFQSEIILSVEDGERFFKLLNIQQ
jgi:hypothetical protein